MRVSTKAAFIDAIVDEAGAPTITDVRLDGTGWTGLGAYSFSSIVAAGEQFRPIFTEGVNKLEIEFSENVLLDGSELDLQRTERLVSGSVVTSSVVPTNFVYDVGAHVATWTFGALGDGKYAIHLDDSITDVGLNRLDAEWNNDDNEPGNMNLIPNTPDNRDDDVSKPFVTGNGVAGTMAPGGESAFRFHFALLAGDYDGDGIVEAVETGGNGDGNGDGIVDGADETIRNTNEGNMLPLRAYDGADFNDDEIVNSLDLAIWAMNYGQTGAIPEQGDANNDGVVSGADFLIWQQRFGDMSAWYTGPAFAGIGGTAALFLVGVAPQVTNVTISGSISVHDPYSFDTVDGSGTQLQTVPVGGADTISITFSELVNISADSLNIIGLQTANAPVLAEFSYDSMTMTATWRFEGWALGDQYLLSLHDSVTDIEGNLLDGEWVNPFSMSTVNAAVSEFPSGDGTAGGHFNFVMTLLAGDIDLNGEVDEDDLGLWMDISGSAPSPSTWIFGDFNGDGVSDSVDWQILEASFELTNIYLPNLQVLADLNGDFDVDDNDLQTIADNYGMTGATYADGDLNGDGIIDDADLDLAFAQFSLGFDWAA